MPNYRRPIQQRRKMRKAALSSRIYRWKFSLFRVYAIYLFPIRSLCKLRPFTITLMRKGDPVSSWRAGSVHDKQEENRNRQCGNGDVVQTLATGVRRYGLCRSCTEQQCEPCPRRSIPRQTPVRRRCFAAVPYPRGSRQTNPANEN